MGVLQHTVATKWLQPLNLSLPLPNLLWIGFNLQQGEVPGGHKITWFPSSSWVVPCAAVWVFNAIRGHDHNHPCPATNLKIREGKWFLWVTIASSPSKIKGKFSLPFSPWQPCAAYPTSLALQSPTTSFPGTIWSWFKNYHQQWGGKAVVHTLSATGNLD